MKKHIRILVVVALVAVTFGAVTMHEWPMANAQIGGVWTQSQAANAQAEIDFTILTERKRLESIKADAVREAKNADDEVGGLAARYATVGKWIDDQLAASSSNVELQRMDGKWDLQFEEFQALKLETAALRALVEAL